MLCEVDSSIAEYVNSRVVITLVRVSYHCKWGFMVLDYQIIVLRPQCEDSVGLHIFR